MHIILPSTVLDTAERERFYFGELDIVYFKLKRKIGSVMNHLFVTSRAGYIIGAYTLHISVVYMSRGRKLNNNW